MKTDYEQLAGDEITNFLTDIFTEHGYEILTKNDSLMTALSNFVIYMYKVGKYGINQH